MSAAKSAETPRPKAVSNRPEIPKSGTRDEKSRPVGGELKNLVEPIGIEPTTS